MRQSRMQFLLVAISAALAGSAHALSIIASNDDGWAHVQIRALYSALTEKGHKVVISAPADNESGARSKTATPVPRKKPCQFDSCPANSPAVGNNESVPEWNYVNSYPATCMSYGIEKLAPKFFDDKAPDLAVTGINTGMNLGFATWMSGTVGAAAEAVRKHKIPAVAFSGAAAESQKIPWNVDPVPPHVPLYAGAAARFIEELTHQGPPYMPAGTWINVNMPMAGPGTACEHVDDFKFVLSRTFVPWAGVSMKDVSTCGRKGRLPTGWQVTGGKKGGRDCYVSVSLMYAKNKRDASARNQKVLLERLSGFLDCLPRKDGYESLEANKGDLPYPPPSRGGGYEATNH